MVIVVKLFGLIIAVFGVIYLLKPNIMKNYAAFWGIGKRIYAGAALAFIFGVIFLLAAPQSAATGLVTALGILSVIKGILLSVLKPEKGIAMINWWVERPLGFLRIHALFALVLGLLLIYLT